MKKVGGGFGGDLTEVKVRGGRCFDSEALVTVSGSEKSVEGRWFTIVWMEITD